MLRFVLSLFFLGGVLSIVISSCQDDSLPDDSSFGLIQTRILDTSCAIGGCHSSEQDDTFVQHGLVLTSSVAYENLVNAEPVNTQAKADNLLRVKPLLPDESLLFHKLHNEDHHEHSYGNPMPLGLPLLSMGKVEFIRLWIEAGAPAEGHVADVALLDDETPQPENFEPLIPPPPGEGFQMNLPKFTVAPNFEREFFVYKQLGNTGEIFVNRIEIKMRQNSHHFILYDFNKDLPDVFRPAYDFVRDIRNSDGSLNIANMFPMAYHVFVTGSQSPYFEFTLPSGVAIALPAQAALDFNSHYVNKSPFEIEGEVNVNFYTVTSSAVQKIAQTLNLQNNDLTLPARQRITVSKTFLSDKSISILSLTSHTHQLGEKFVIKIKGGSRDGEIVYTNNDWHHPPLISFNPPIVINVGEGLTSEITYNNTKDKTVKFGLTSEDEMGIIFGYFVEN